MGIFMAEKKKVSFKGMASLGWFLGRGYVQKLVTAKSEKWCVINKENKKRIAIFESESMAKQVAIMLNDFYSNEGVTK